MTLHGQHMDALAAKEEKKHSKELDSHLAAEAKKAGETKEMLVSPALDAKQDDHLVAWWWVAPWDVVVMLCAWNVTRESRLLVALLLCMLQWATFVTMSGRAAFLHGVGAWSSWWFARVANTRSRLRRRRMQRLRLRLRLSSRQGAREDSEDKLDKAPPCQL